MFEPRFTFENPYNADCMRLWGKNLSFLDDPRFVRAAKRAAANFSGGFTHHYRAYICLWAAQNGLRIDGDFVECGVGAGVTSTFICDYLDFNSTGKRVFLFDTFSGIPRAQMSKAEVSLGREKHNASYAECSLEHVANCFKEWPSVKLIKGEVPATLNEVVIERVAYLHLDMNIALPEKAAIEHFWPRLSRGAIVVLDDYAWDTYEAQYAAMNYFAHSVGAPILTLPTGQGMLIKG